MPGRRFPAPRILQLPPPRRAPIESPAAAARGSSVHAVHIIRRNLWSLCSVIALAVGVTQPGFAETQPPEAAQAALVDAIAKLKAWRGSFSTLRVQYKWANPSQLVARLPALKDDERKLAGWYHETEWSWTDRQLARESTQHFEDDLLKTREVWGYNQRLAFSAIYEGDSRFPKQLVAGPAGLGHSPQIRPCVPLHMLCFPKEAWLPDLIEKNSTVPVRQAEIHGSTCVGFRMNAEATDVIWLDPQHDGLVRRTESNAGLNWECTEFQQLKSGRWFPRRGHYAAAGASDQPYWFEVLAVEMNQPMPASDFEPPPFDSTTTVTDRTHGLLEAASRRRPPRTVASAAAEPATTAAPQRAITATPHRSLWLWRAALVASVLVLLSAWFRRGNSR